MQMQSLTSAVGMIWFLFASRNHIVHLISGRPLFFKWNSFTSLQIIYGGSETQFLVLHSISLIFNVDFLYQIIYLVYVYYQIQIKSIRWDMNLKLKFCITTHSLSFIIIGTRLLWETPNKNSANCKRSTLFHACLSISCERFSTHLCHIFKWYNWARIELRIGC